MEVVEFYPVAFFHPPKVRAPEMFTAAIEKICYKFKCLARFSECPIAVCRWQNRKSSNDSVHGSC